MRMQTNITNESVVRRGIKVITDERDVLDGLASQLGDGFAAVVRLVAECRGKVVFSGIGKSGRVAEKIVASMSSLGIPSVFLHSTEALHGDIGVVQEEDVVFVISNSGTTKEVLDIVPVLRRLGATTIAISKSTDTPLAKAADLALTAGVDAEVDDNNLAPTASTTAQLVLGDALAVAASELKGLTRDDFALRHPAGALGSQLSTGAGSASAG